MPHITLLMTLDGEREGSKEEEEKEEAQGRITPSSDILG